MKRSLAASVLVFAITALIGTVLNVYSDAKAGPQASATAPAGDSAVYWAQS